MRTVRFLEEAVGAERRSVDRWYVTDGIQAIGPVAFDLLLRGLELGRVPIESYVRHEGWRLWKPLEELASIRDDGAGPEQAGPGGSGPFQLDLVDPAGPPGAALSSPEEPAEVSPFAATLEELEELEEDELELVEPVEPVEPEELEPEELEAIEPEPRTERIPSRPPPASAPDRREGDLEGAGEGRDRREAALELLGEIARAAGAEVALFVEAAEGSEDGPTVRGVYREPGPDGSALDRVLLDRVLVGERLSAVDPVALAAAAGQALVAEPEPGPAGLALSGRRIALGLDAGFGAMLPIGLAPPGEAARAPFVCRGWIELGSAAPFRLAGLAEAERIAARLAQLGALGPLRAVSAAA